jgi:signal transduction histidine kinase
MVNKILIIDDVEENNIIVKKILEEDGLDIVVTKSGYQGIKYSEELDFDLFLIDIRMPEIDGLEVCAFIKQSEKNHHKPVLFFVAKTDYDNISRAFDYGGVDIITKPFNKKELLARVNTQLKLYNQNKTLYELNKTKDMFFSIISHDLRSPFTSIIGFNDLLIKHTEDFTVDKIKSIAQMMLDTSKQTLSLLENLLEWSRLQTGKIQLKLEAFYPAEIINEVLRQCESSSVQKRIDLTALVNCNERVIADKSMIKTVLRNLLTNAIKFTNPEGKIVLNADRKDNAVLFSVSDNGIGIKLESISKIFLLEHNTTQRGTSNEKGTGLGLVLCREFLEKHHAKLKVESTVGVGTIFSFELPLQNYNQ